MGTYGFSKQAGAKCKLTLPFPRVKVSTNTEFSDWSSYVNVVVTASNAPLTDLF